MQILVQKFDEGIPNAIDPDEVEVIDVTQEKQNDWSFDWSGVFLRTWLLLLLNVQLF